MADTIYSRPGDTFFTELDNAPTGLVGTVRVQVIDKATGTAVIPRTSVGITEIPAGSGRYVFSASAPETEGHYTVLWDRGSITPGETAADDLVVTHSIANSLEGESGRILSLGQYKALRDIDNNNQDSQIEAAIPAAEDAVVRYAQRAFNAVPTTETRSFVYENQPIIEIDDATAVSEVKFDGRPIATSEFILGPQGSDPVFYWIELLDIPWSAFDPLIDPFLVNVNPGRRRSKRVVEITAAYGWPVIPQSVVQAAAWLVDEFAVESSQGQGLTAEAIVDYNRVWGSESNSEPPVLPPRVRQILDPFRRVLL